MRKSIYYLTSMLILALPMFISCQPSDEKLENAEQAVLDAQKDLNESMQNLYDLKLDTITTYAQFKIESEKIIIAQELRITEYKTRMITEKKEINADYTKKLEELKAKNMELRAKIETYKNLEQDKWVEFKSELNHDLNELGKDFINLTIENEDSTHN